MKINLTLSLLLISMLACTSTDQQKETIDLEQIKADVRQAEKDFNDLAARKGVPAAFLAFAAEDAVLNRNNQIFKGKEAIKTYFDAGTLQNVSLIWAPDFVEVSASGDMAYTYGKYQFSAVGSTGQEIKSEGIFHTVWKKQIDGSWKFVYD